MTRRLRGIAGALAASGVSAIVASAFVTPTSAAYFVDVETIRASARAGSWDVEGETCADDERRVGSLCLDAAPTANDEPENPETGNVSEAPAPQPESAPAEQSPKAAPVEPQTEPDTQPESESKPKPAEPEPVAPSAQPEVETPVEAEPNAAHTIGMANTAGMATES